MSSLYLKRRRKTELLEGRWLVCSTGFSLYCNAQPSALYCLLELEDPECLDSRNADSSLLAPVIKGLDGSTQPETQVDLGPNYSMFNLQGIYSRENPGKVVSFNISIGVLAFDELLLLIPRKVVAFENV